MRRVIDKFCKVDVHPERDKIRIMLQVEQCKWEQHFRPHAAS
jgi:hypothetical protein